MKKTVKYIMEIIFIFIIPLLLIIFNINIKKVYDENNNEIEKSLEFNENLIEEYAGNLQYKNILNFNQKFQFNDSVYYSKVNDYTFEMGSNSYATSVYLCSLPSYTYGHVYYMYLDSSSPIVSSSFLYVYWSYNNGANFAGISSSGNEFYGVYSPDNSDIFIRVYPEDNVGSIIKIQMFDLTQMFGSGYEPTASEFRNNYINGYYNYTDSEIEIVYSNDIISSNYESNYSWYSKLFNNLFSALNINNNIPLTIIIIYTLLWLIMWFIWHLLYLPIDFICSKLLFDRVDK